jgi:regulator of protease activity HflC (stomatin/prohibitin superfamily)
MLARLVIAIVIGVLVTLACIFVGGLLVSSASIGWVTDTGTFLKTYGALLGLLAALWSFFANGTNGGPGWFRRGPNL